MMKTLAGLLLLGLIGCGAPDPNGQKTTGLTVVPTGTWGGPHLTLTVTATGATTEYDCAAGQIDGPMTLDASGHFDLSGTHDIGHGGPSMPGEVPNRHPARYTGSTDGKTMNISVTLTDLHQDLGAYTVTLGQQGALYRCL